MLTTMQKVSWVPRLIHKSKVTPTVANLSTNENTYYSIVFVNIARICSLPICFLDGKFILESHMRTRRRTHWFSTKDNEIHFLAMSNTKFWRKFTCGKSNKSISLISPHYSCINWHYRNTIPSYRDQQFTELTHIISLTFWGLAVFILQFELPSHKVNRKQWRWNAAGIITPRKRDASHVADQPSSWIHQKHNLRQNRNSPAAGPTSCRPPWSRRNLQSEKLGWTSFSCSSFFRWLEFPRLVFCHLLHVSVVNLEVCSINMFIQTCWPVIVVVVYNNFFTYCSSTETRVAHKCWVTYHTPHCLDNACIDTASIK